MSSLLPLIYLWVLSEDDVFGRVRMDYIVPVLTFLHPSTVASEEGLCGKVDLKAVLRQAASL